MTTKNESMTPAAIKARKEAYAQKQAVFAHEFETFLKDKTKGLTIVFVMRTITTMLNDYVSEYL